MSSRKLEACLEHRAVGRDGGDDDGRGGGALGREPELGAGGGRGAAGSLALHLELVDELTRRGVVTALDSAVDRRAVGGLRDLPSFNRCIV